VTPQLPWLAVPNGHDFDQTPAHLVDERAFEESINLVEIRRAARGPITWSMQFNGTDRQRQRIFSVPRLFVRGSFPSPSGWEFKRAVRFPRAFPWAAGFHGFGVKKRTS
jgi:hypothetical protein